jgi:hypothetical protein
MLPLLKTQMIEDASEAIISKNAASYNTQKAMEQRRTNFIYW